MAEELFPFDPPLTDDFPVETELRKLLTGHEGGNAEHSQGVSDELVAPALDQLYRVFNQAIRGLIDSRHLNLQAAGVTISFFQREIEDDQDGKHKQAVQDQNQRQI